MHQLARPYRIHHYLSTVTQIRGNLATAKVWIVDDDSSIRWVLERTLGSEGFGCRFAGRRSPAASLEMRSPDVILSDIRMPGIDGL